MEHETETTERDDRLETQTGGIMLVNTFTPKPGKLEEFVELQAQEAQRLIGTTPIPGWRGNRLLQSVDTNTAIGIALFDSISAHKQWVATNDFSDHFKRIAHLLERADPRYYKVAFQAGRI